MSWVKAMVWLGKIQSEVDGPKTGGYGDKRLDSDD
jgi:hypothetical protein